MANDGIKSTGFRRDQVMQLLRDIVAMPLKIERTPRVSFSHSRGRFRLDRDNLDPNFEFFRSVFNAVPLNPNKADYSAAIREAFVLAPESKEPDQPALPSQAGFDALLRDLLDPGIRLIYLVGQRGCGKTACINYFLDIHHEDLNRRGITWFRTDLAKLYEERIKDPEAPTIEEYHRAHCIYIALKYAEKDELLSPFQRAAGGAADSCPFYAHLKNLPDSMSMREMWSGLVGAFRSFSSNSLEFSRFVVRNYDRAGHGNGMYVLLYREMLARITRNDDGRQRQAIQILDGIDNVDRIGAAEHYHKFIGKLNAMIGTRDKPVQFAKTVVLLRPESLQDLNTPLEELLVPTQFRLPRVRYIQPVDPRQLVLHKLKIVREPRSDYYRKDKERAQGYPGFDHRWERLAETFVKIYFEELGKICGARENSAGHDRMVLDKLFNQNLRSMCINLIASYQYAKSVLSRTANVSDPQSGDRELEEALRANRRLVFEGSITAGEPMMLPHDLRRGDEASWCPNLFDFPIADPVLRWEGLCLYRALQFLQFHRGGCVDRTLRDYLEHSLRYSSSVVKQAFKTGWQYGLWQVVDYAGAGTERDPMLGLSEKGQFLLGVVFERPEITYFMATATRLKPDHHESSNLWRLHDPRRDHERAFVPSLVKSALTMMRYVASAHVYEVKREYLREPQSAWAPPTDNMRRWRQTMFRYIVNYSRYNRVDAEELIKDLRGIVPEA